MSVKNAEFIINYVNEVKTQFESGHAKEHAYRPALERLMSSFDNVIAVNDPKRSAHGNPDFVFLNPQNKDIILGYAEAKDVDVSLDKIEKTDQLLRYAGYDNLFLTNYLEFRFYQNGNKYETISIASIEGDQLKLNPESYSHLADELQQFLQLSPETIKSGKRLAQIMGAKARRIRDNVKRYLENSEDEKNQELEKMFNMMKELLVHDLTIEKFADMYAQTLVYGLFVARYNDKSPDTFTRGEARDLVPASNPFLREFFDHIVGTRFDKRLAYIVDELCEVFSVSDVNALVHKHLKILVAVDEKDPIIHFYEDFLKEYDPEERKRMGAYYTPLPVVRFIINQVDDILKKEFGIPKGLADIEKKKIAVERQGKKIKQDLHRVQILDPAVGTATFLNEVINHIYSGFKGQEGRWPSYVENDLLPRLFGFELMMAPYTIAHLKLGMTLQEMGVRDFNQRIGVYLTNTLEEGIKRQPDLFSYGLAEVVSEESHAAGTIKHEKPIMVIIGNPPYSLMSSNMGAAQKQMVQRYKYIDGNKIVEKGALQLEKNLNDDYVKFIAFAEDLIEKNGEGIVAMITSNSYVDNPTLRGMRYHLAKTFDQIYILDLHGDTMKKETTNTGGKDENVFQIMKGVSIIVGVKKTKSKTSRLASVFHSELFGLRKDKFAKLNSMAINGVSWSKVNLRAPNYTFQNKNWALLDKYEEYTPIDKLFIQSGAGIITARDNFILSDLSDSDLLVSRVNTFINSDDSNENLCKTLGISLKKGWDIDSARMSLKNKQITPQDLSIISYRPFDDKLIYYDKALVWSMSKPTMQHMINHKNIGLIIPRQAATNEWSHVQVTDKIVDNRYHYSNKGVPSEFPLYLYHNDGTKTPNFNPVALKEFTKNLHNPYQPEDILDYSYAVLSSSNYRKRYLEFLKTDFPRVPNPKNDLEFQEFVNFGRELRGLHLMNSPKSTELITTYPVVGENEVEKILYKNGDVYINKEQYFGQVPEVAWNFYIGGYQPAQKWLKDRKGRRLTNEDIEHYQRIIKVLSETSKVVEKIDSLYK